MEPSVVTASPLFVSLEVIGTIAFAVSGAMAAGRAKMDWLGAIVLAIVVAVGGGTIRDLLLGRLPVSWLQHYWPVLIAGITGVLVIIALRVWPEADPENWISVTVADALGLSAFVIIGTEVGLQSNLAPPLAVLLGVITGVGGGVLRDLLTGRRPMVLVGQVYAVAGIVGGALFAVLVETGANVQLAVWLSVGVVFGLRMVAVNRNWNLPKVLPESGQ